MRLIVTNACALMIAGCGGLERHSYPVNSNHVLTTATVQHVQPYTGSGSESGLSRAGWGVLSGGLIVGAFAGLSEGDIGQYNAFSYLLRSGDGESHIINSYSSASPGDCIIVHGSVEQEFHTFSVTSLAECE